MKKNFYSNEDWSRETKESTAAGEEEPYRAAPRKDYARLIHSPAFRRLQRKTQLFPGEESDFFRNRLTHSLEVAQIAKSIAIRLNYQLKDERIGDQLDTDLVEFAGLAHDLGHPPFGHTGEKALDEKMKNYGGFEGNAQTIRILSRLEKRKVEQVDENSSANDFTEFRDGRDMRRGLNVAARSLASVLKYDNKIPERRAEGARLVKGYYASEEKLIDTVKKRVLNGYKLKKDEKFKTIEMQIMDMADDISYSTYDFEDAMKAGFISPIELIAKVNNNNDLVGAVAKKLFAEEVDRPYPESNQSPSDKDKFDEIKQKAVDVVTEMFLDIFKEAIPPHLYKDLIKKRKKSDQEVFATLFGYLSTVTAETRSKAIQENGYNRSFFTSRLVGKRIRSITVELHSDCLPLSKIKIPAEIQFEISTLKHLTYEIQINAPRLKLIEYRGKEIISRLFDCLSVDKEGELFPADWRSRLNGIKASADCESLRMRTICDYISGMTDNYALELYRRLNYASSSLLFRPT